MREKSFDEFGRDLQNYINNNVNNINKLIVDSTNYCLRQTQLMAPVKTGKHRQNITANITQSGTNIKGEVKSGVDYAVFLEYGTLKQKAQPHFQPAAQMTKQYIQNTIQHNLQENKRKMES